MGLFSGLFRARDAPQNRTSGSTYSFFMGGSTSGKRVNERSSMQNLVDTLEGMPDAVDSFDEGAWYALVDHATVYGRDDVRFTFKNGMEIKA